MHFRKQRSHDDRYDRADGAFPGACRMAGGERGEHLLSRGFFRGEGRGGPFGRRGGPGGGFGSGFDGGRDEGHRHGRGGGHAMGRGRGQRMFGQGELRLLLLGLVVDQDRHGYDLIRAVEDLTGGAYAPSPGVVYPTLSLLVDEALIAEAPGEGARKAFTATEAGRAEVAARQGELDAIQARLKTLADATSREASPPVMRAMTNLKLALKGRVFAPSFDQAVAHQIADILDDAARKIERL